MDTQTNDLNITQSTSSFVDKIRSVSITTWIIIIFVLAFLGINLFVYLAKGTQQISDFLKPITDIFVKLFGKVSTQVVDVSAEGAKAVVGTTASTVNSGLTGVQKIANGGANIKDTIPQPDIMSSNSLNRALNSSQQRTNSNGQYDEDDTDSNIQQGAGKSGWCLVGSDRGVRSCVQVGANDDCMSGDIFSTRDICINPKLRV